MILELSSPIITLSKSTALLPLVGDIDTERAKFILENTLQACAKRRVEHLLIDLSGVVVVDTMVAHQIFKLIEALNLIGVSQPCQESGLRLRKPLYSWELTFRILPLKPILPKH